MWDKLAGEEMLEKTVAALTKNGFAVIVAENGKKAKREVLKLLQGAEEVMEMPSETLKAIGVSEELAGSSKYVLVRDEIGKLDGEANARERRRLGTAPQYAIGSVHAVTQDGKVFIASNSGSQLPAYVYGAEKVIWVVGTQKIVGNEDEARRRVYEHCLPLESERARQAYGIDGSFVSSLLQMNRVGEGRVAIVFVKEKVGF